MENKKTLILSIVGVLVLVIAVVGVSFAMYSFTGTGTRDNVIKTGTVSLNCENQKTITLTNEYPKVDALGSQTAQTLQCDVTADINGTMTIKYEVGFDELYVYNPASTETAAVAGVTENTTYALGTDDINFNISKDGEYILGTEAAKGIKLSSVENTSGTLTDTTGNKLFSKYYLDGGTFTADGVDSFVIKAWVNSDYDLDHTTEHTENVHTNDTTSQKISFKLKVIGVQA